MLILFLIADSPPDKNALSLLHRCSVVRHHLPALRTLPCLDKSAVGSLFLKQFLMCAALSDPAVCHHKDLVGILDCRQPVRDRDDRLASGQFR